MEKLRVWNVINPPRKPNTYSVIDLKSALILIDKLAEEQLENEYIACNAFGLEVWDENADGEGNPGWR